MSQSSGWQSNASQPRTARGWLIWLALGVLVAGGSVAWWYWSRSDADTTAMSAVYSVNNRGVGLMEQFKYEEAAAAFAEVVRMAPDWTPGHVNRAIALYNRNKPEFLEQATAIFRQVLDKEPDEPHAHFCLGYILHFRDRDKALPHFEKVTQIDPNDAHAWYFRGLMLDLDKADEKLKCLERAVQLDPHLRSAIYGLAQMLHRSPKGSDQKRADSLDNAQKALDRFYDQEKSAYGEPGRYSEVISTPPRKHQAANIGPIPLFHPDDRLDVKLKTGARWARALDFGKDATANLRREIRRRFGATMVVLDFNRDGLPDLFLAGAVVEDDQVRDLLLKNRGFQRGRLTFEDVTHEAGLAETRPSLGCTVADFDNDGYPDIFITGAGRNWLFQNQSRNKGAKAVFADVTREAGLDKMSGVCLGSCFVDLDQDMDLDLLIARYAASSEETLESLAGKGVASGGLRVFLNVGEAKVPLNVKEDAPPLRPAFRKFDAKSLSEFESAMTVAAVDLDGDRDTDVLVLADRTGGSALINDRLLRLRSASLPAALTGTDSWNGALVLDANHDRRSDLFLIRPAAPPILLLSQPAIATEQNLEKLYQEGPCHSPTLIQAQAIDIDNDGWTDVIGLSEKGRPVLLHNRGGKLAHASEGLGSDAAWPNDIIALGAVSLGETCFPDMLIWSEGQGLQWRRNLGNAMRAIDVTLVGHRKVESEGRTVRCNADGIGTWVVAQSADFWTGLEYTTLSAGLGQSLQPIHLGLGKHSAEVLRLRWPDNCWQAELELASCKPLMIDQRNRKPDSCPVLFTWDGERYTCVTDFLGVGTLGEAMPDGTCMQPRPEETVKIEPRQLKPRDGFYVLKIAEPMDEVTYLDHLQLAVIDQPPGISVYPDERFTLSGPPPSQDLLAFRDGQRVFPVKASDHRGRDVTETLRHRDRKMVNGFARRAWTGFAEDHWVELDFGEQLAKYPQKDALVLFLAGWTDYAYPDSMWAANQAGISLQPPTLHRLGSDGTWTAVSADMGFPAGLPRMMAVDVTGKLGGGRCVLRIKTNMCVFWDQAFIAPVAQRGQPGQLSHCRVLDVHDAELEKRGFMKEVSPDGRQPALYDYDQLERPPFTRQNGKLTRLGSVTELLRERDDCFVIFGPGEEVSVRFDGRGLPALPSGWQRSFVLRTAGYCKGCGPFTMTGGDIAPLPFRAMSRFPYGPAEHYPRTPRHHDYQRRYNTRTME